jgi:MOB kinase activator 1
MKALFSWMIQRISDRTLFPIPEANPGSRDFASNRESDPDVPMDHFPSDFREVVSNMLRRLFRVFAHMYWSHYRRIEAIGLKEELDSRFIHLVLFLLEFNLIESRELRPLHGLIMARLHPSITSGIEWT